jgi:hypothetical protein
MTLLHELGVSLPQFVFKKALIRVQQVHHYVLRLCSPQAQVNKLIVQEVIIK